MKVLICILLLCNSVIFATPLSNIQLQAPVIEARNSVQFVVTIRAILTDPIEGYWIECSTNDTLVLIWENDVHDLAIGVKYEVLCTYAGYKVYPHAGQVDIFDGIFWEAIE